ncbi:hypothetical protein [Cronobacter sakazakii]|uniref:hypothetical protein n=1 Tax=Cronobacter sakazakii TaxID=28141 RepID=UPI000CFAA79D|nr:hypothetical protein [Cronobacter sakazakii]MDQ9179330.1 hypothetical protein [Cronobacter sakazakii]MDQ9192142.1 hypothetical protein [Cronobacter sakazakii]
MAVGTFDLMDFLSKAGVGLITGVVAAIVTAKVALKRFYHEKWWEKKHIAYNQLVDDLIELKSLYGQAHYYAEEKYNAGKNDKPREGRTVDWKRYHQLLRQVQRHFVLAPISLSQSTKELLSRFIEKDAGIEHNVAVDGYPEFMAYSDMSGETQKIIDAIVMDAKKELKFR